MESSNSLSDFIEPIICRRGVTTGTAIHWCENLDSRGSICPYFIADTFNAGNSGTFAAGISAEGTSSTYYAYLWNFPSWKLTHQIAIDSSEAVEQGMVFELADVNMREQLLLVVISLNETSLKEIRLYKFVESGGIFCNSFMVDSVKFPDEQFYVQGAFLVRARKNSFAQDIDVNETWLYGLGRGFRGILKRVKHYMNSEMVEDRVVTRIDFGRNTLGVTYDQRWPDLALAHTDDGLLLRDVWSGRQISRIFKHEWFPWYAQLLPPVSSVDYTAADSRVPMKELRMMSSSFNEYDGECGSDIRLHHLKLENSTVHSELLNSFRMPVLIRGLAPRGSLLLALSANGNLSVADLDLCKQTRELRTGLDPASGRSMMTVGDDILIFGLEGVYVIRNWAQKAVDPVDVVTI